MKRNSYITGIFFIPAVAAAFASCSKEEGGTREEVAPAAYSLSVSAGCGHSGSDTRASLNLNDYTYSWDPAEQVALTVTSQGTTTALTGLKNVTLTGTNTTQTAHATFKGDLTETQYRALTAGEVFDYYSYYPTTIYGLNNNSFPASLDFTIPSSFTVSPGTFIGAAYAPMVAVVKEQAPTITFPAGEPTTLQDTLLHFRYEHVMSYAAIEMDVRLLPEKVTRIVMTVGDALTDNTRINGAYSCNTVTGARTLSGGSNSVTIDIPAGLDIGQVVYIPMPVKDMTGQTFKFAFTTAGSSGNAYREIPAKTAGINFEKGKIHPIKLAPAAQYASGAAFTVTRSGYYYIEAWGGNGGSGSNTNGSRTGGTGGAGASIRGLYYFEANQSINVQVGDAGKSGSGHATAGAGGAPLGTDYGLGRGGNGGASNTGGGSGNAGGGGGGATGIKYGGNVVLVAGGGGGGGGASGGTTVALNPSNGGSGGAAGGAGSTGGAGGAGGAGSNGRDGKGGSGSGTGGNNGGGGSAGGTTTGVSGGNGGGGANGWGAYTSGSGGGGGGGGYLIGGGGGGGADAGGFFSSSGAGGGGAGGSSFLSSTNYYGSAPAGYTIPAPATRPATSGYVVITFVRPNR